MSQQDSTSPDVLDLYKLAVEMADRTSARRAAANTFFVTLHASIATAFGVIGTIAQAQKVQLDGFTFATLASVGMVLSLTWGILLRYYRRLNRAKFAVINKLEEDLPVQIFTDEWEELRPSANVPANAGRKERFWIWVKKKKHSEASLIEQVVPAAFFVIYLILGLRIWL